MLSRGLTYEIERKKDSKCLTFPEVGVEMSGRIYCYGILSAGRHETCMRCVDHWMKKGNIDIWQVQYLGKGW